MGTREEGSELPFTSRETEAQDGRPLALGHRESWLWSQGWSLSLSGPRLTAMCVMSQTGAQVCLCMTHEHVCVCVCSPWGKAAGLRQIGELGFCTLRLIRIFSKQQSGGDPIKT